MSEQKHNGLVRDLVPHAAWRGIEVGWELVRSSLLAVILAGWLTLKQHLDVLAIVIAFAACFVLLIWKDISLSRAVAAGENSQGTARPPAATAPLPLPDRGDETSVPTANLARAAAIRILDGNEAMLQSVSHLIDTRAADIKKVIVVQFSGVNVVPTVREIYRRTSAEIEVYLADPSRGVNAHQVDRIKEWQGGFANELKNIRTPGGTWQQFTYDAPGSLRAVLIEGVVLFVGAYLYEVVELRGENVLDIRGGEKPLFEVPSTHPGFHHLEVLIQAMVKNWKQEQTPAGLTTATLYRASLRSGLARP